MDDGKGALQGLVISRKGSKKDQKPRPTQEVNLVYLNWELEEEQIEEF